MADSQEITAKVLLSTRLHLGFTSTFLFLAIASTAARFYARQAQGRHSWGWDDALIPFALLSLMATCGAAMAQAHFRGLYFLPSVPDDEGTLIWIESQKAAYSSAISVNIASVLPKVSICCLYLRFVRGRKTRIIAKGTSAFLMIDCISFLFPAIFNCNPPRAYWTAQDTPSATCINGRPFSLARGIPHILTDIIILILPLPTVKALHLPMRKRIGIAITFVLGGAGFIGCTTRWVFYLMFDHKIYFDEGQKTFLRDTIVNLVWEFEPTMYLVAANLPPLGNLLQRSIGFKLPRRIRALLPLGSSKESDKGLGGREMQRFRRQNAISDPVQTPFDQQVQPNAQGILQPMPKRLNPGISDVSNQMMTQFADELRNEIGANRTDDVV